MQICKLIYNLPGQLKTREACLESSSVGHPEAYVILLFLGVMLVVVIRLDELHRSPIPSFFRILIRFKVWMPINTSL
jgi:hypothetical protein